jgi:hypothetical protein
MHRANRCLCNVDFAVSRINEADHSSERKQLIRDFPPSVSPRKAKAARIGQDARLYRRTLFLERKGDETLEQALERSDFSDVSDVLNAL